MSDYEPRLATPIRPYADDAPLVAVHESAWDDAEQAFSRVLQLEDDLASCDAYARRMLARAHALADEWEQTDWNQTPHGGCLDMYRHCARQLRSALPERETEPEQETEAAEAVDGQVGK